MSGRQPCNCCGALTALDALNTAGACAECARPAGAVDVLAKYGRLAVETFGDAVSIVDEETLSVAIADVRGPNAADRAHVIVAALNNRAAVAELVEAAKMARYSGCVNYLIPVLVRLGEAHPSDAAKYAALARVGGAS